MTFLTVCMEDECIVTNVDILFYIRCSSEEDDIGNIFWP